MEKIRGSGDVGEGSSESQEFELTTVAPNQVVNLHPKLTGCASAGRSFASIPQRRRPYCKAPAETDAPASGSRIMPHSASALGRPKSAPLVPITILNIAMSEHKLAPARG